MKEGSIYILIYILLWIVVYRINRNRCKYFGASSLLILLNIIYAVSSFVLYNNSIMSFKYQYQTMTLLPFVYLFVSQMIVMSPILRYKEVRIESFQTPSTIIIKFFSYLFVFSTIFLLPYIISNMWHGLTLIALEEQGADIYAATHDNLERDYDLLERITSIIVNNLGDIGILFFFYILSQSKKENNKFLIWGYVFSISVILLLPLSKGLRTDVTMKILTLLIAYVTMRKFLPQEIKSYAKKGGVILFGAIAFIFLALSISRFGDREGGGQLYFLSYVGQANIHFNEYGLDANGIRYGDRTANTFKKILGFENVPKDIHDTRARYSNMKIGDEVFSTYVGDFTLDYGPVIAFVIFCIFAALVNNAVNYRRKTILFHDLLLLYFVMCITVQGGFYLFDYSFKSNYTILTFIIMYIIFRMDYNGKLKMK